MKTRIVHVLLVGILLLVTAPVSKAQGPDDRAPRPEETTLTIVSPPSPDAVPPLSPDSRLSAHPNGFADPNRSPGQVEPNAVCVCFVPVTQWVYNAVSSWLGYNIDAWAWENGYWFRGTNALGTVIDIRTVVKLGPRAFYDEAAKLGDAPSREINSLLQQFLNGNSNPGIGTKYLAGNIYYLRGANGGRLFYKKVGTNAYEIIAYADKNNEQRVINLIYQYYLP